MLISGHGLKSALATTYKSSFLLQKQESVLRIFFYRAHQGGASKLLKFQVPTPWPLLKHVFEGFLRHFDFWTIIDFFSTFFRGYFQPRKNLKKVENYVKYRSFFDFEIFKKKIFWNFFFRKTTCISLDFRLFWDFFGAGNILWKK